MSDLLLTNIVRPGERIDLQSINYNLSDDADPSEELGDEKKFYISKVYDVLDDETLEILMPMERTKMLLLPVDEEFEVFFYAQKGIFTCRVRVAERYRTETAAVVKLELLTDLSKHQRREYYRYSTVIGMTSKKLTEEEEQEYLETRQLPYGNDPQDKSVIVDISGGGIRFVSSMKYELNDLIHCRYILHVKEENQMFDCVIRILGTKPVANNVRNTEYRGQFLFLNNFERESIIRFIFDEERKMRQRR